MDRTAAERTHERAARDSQEETQSNRYFLVGLARAFAGAILFSLPMLMTMEMWWLGFYMDRLRLALFLILMIPLLTRLSYYAGFEETFNIRQDMMDAFTAYGVGFVASAIVLTLFGILRLDQGVNDILGKISLQAVPASIGAMLATSQLGGPKPAEPGGPSVGYGGEVFLMAVGALFLGFNVAPTEEMVLIAYKMTHWHAILLILASLGLMHAFVYSVGFHGSETDGDTSVPSTFLRFTVVGYITALLVSAYVLWTFGRMDGVGPAEIAGMIVVLGFPASLGAAAARLVL